MNERPCIRCHHPVLLEAGHLVYCSHCGTPQIFLSEALQAEIAQQTEDYHQRNAAQSTPDAAEPGASRGWRAGNPRQPWPQAVRYALLSGAVALVLGLVSLVFAPAGVILLLWAVAAPILTVSLFIARSVSNAQTSSGFAARLGLLTGTLVGLAAALVCSGSLVVARFVEHDTAAFDAQIALLFAQERTMLLQRMGAAAQPTVDMLNIPEFRVGLLLCMIATSATLYLLLSTLAAGLTGAVLGRRRAA